MVVAYNNIITKKENFMKIIDIDRDFVVRCLGTKIFYDIVGEFEFLKKYHEGLANVLQNNITCSGCTENNVVKPAVHEFIMYTIAMDKAGETEFFERMKAFTLCYLDERNFQLRLQYQMDETSPIRELLV